MPEQGLYQAILEGDAKTAIQITRQAVGEAVAPMTLIREQMIPAMDEAGRRFQCQEYFVPELLLSARAMKGALELLRPLLAESAAEPAGRVVIGTVKGDLHDIGKNLVSSVLEGAGFEVTDLGVDVPPARFIAAVREHKAQIVCLSALLTTTMSAMRSTIQALEGAGIRKEIKVIVGGAPVTQRYADEIGADGYSDDATGAVEIARALAAERRA